MHHAADGGDGGTPERPRLPPPAGAPVGAWRGNQRGNAVDQLQRCEVQLICLGTTLVTGAALQICGKRFAHEGLGGVVVALAVELTRADQL